jgi:energy-coupling factor transporter transmembrane protein EcfT
MSTLHTASIQQSARSTSLGTYGHLAIFGWMLAMVMLASGGMTAVAALICLGVTVGVYPGAFRRVFRLRWLIWMLLLVLPTLFFLGERDSLFMGIHYSSEGLQAGLQIMARYIVVLVAVQGFTSAVDITTVAGLLERFGLRGLGFSLGIAINLLPSLQESATHAWHALRMRGGLRRQRWRGMQLLVITIITNALRRAQDISLAAEARAFSPEKARPLPIQRGSLDWLPITLGAVSLLILVLV